MNELELGESLSQYRARLTQETYDLAVKVRELSDGLPRSQYNIMPNWAKRAPIPEEELAEVTHWRMGKRALG